MEKKRNKVKKVSVIVPTHYRDNLLKRALKSIASQTLKPVEVFVVDDTGRKEVREIVKHFSKNSKITYIYLKRDLEGSSPASINLAFKKVTSEYVSILDDDDSWHKTYLNECYKLANKSSSDLIISPFFEVTGDKKKKIGKIVPDDFVLNDWLLFNPGLLCSNMFFKTTSFRKIGGFDGDLSVSGDRDVMIRSMEMGYRYKVLKKPLVNYSIFTPGLSRARLKKYLYSNFRFYLKHSKRMSPYIHLMTIKKFIYTFLSYQYNYLKKRLFFKII